MKLTQDLQKKIVYISNVLLVWLWGKDCLEEPPTVMDLTDVSCLQESCDCLFHDWDFFWAVVYLLDCHGQGVAGIDDAFIVLH